MLRIDCSFSRGTFNLALDAEIGAGATAICGPSGSGKSTFLGLLAGILQPQAGSIVLDGRTLVDRTTRTFVPACERRVGLVFQDGQLFPHLDVRSNLLFGWKRLPASERHFQLDPVLDLLEIRPLLHRRPSQLSGGERQRVALGRAILYSPRPLLLDEPLSSLDARLKTQILPFLRRVRDETRIPMIYVTHALPEAEYIAHRILAMEDGRLLPSPACGRGE